MLKACTHKISLLKLSKIKPFWLFFVIGCFAGAKSTPTFAQSRAIAFKRAVLLDNGISISWLEQTWNANALKQQPVTAADFKLLKNLGFKSIRLPVAFKFYESKHIPIITVIKSIDYVWSLCKQYGFKLVIDYHYGNLNDTNYVAETRAVINTWSIITRKYAKISPDKLFFEIYNEPPPINPQRWKDAAYNIVTALRKIDAKRTFLVGASNYNSIYELSRMVRLADENIIYTCHFYEPFLFTHQGASWVGDQVSTTGVPFPYNVEKFPAINPKAKNTWGETNYYQYKNDGNEQSVKDKLQIVKNWAGSYGVPVICSEYGVYNQYADLDSRCRYIKAVRSVLKELQIPGMLWEYNGNFSVFTGKPAIKNLPACMASAIGYKPKSN